MRLALQWTSGLVLAGCLAWPRLPLAAQGGRTAPVSSGNAGAPNDLVLVSADTPQVHAGPRSVTVVIVPVPRELQRDTAVTYEAIPAGDIQFLGQPTSTVQRWAKEGMPVKRTGRMVQAFPDKLNLWLGRVTHEPVQIATETPDLSVELRRGLAFVRQRRKPRSKVRKHSGRI